MRHTLSDMRTRPPHLLLGLASLVGAALPAIAQAPPQRQPLQPGYTDPAQLDVDWPHHSHLKQPHRGWTQTRRGVDFLAGVGVNYTAPAEADDLATRLLSETGIRAVRIEVGWASVKWDESGLVDARQDRLVRLLKLCKRHHLRPTILLNANSGVPNPERHFDRTLAADAGKGDRTVRLTDTTEIVPGRTGLSNLTEYWAAEAIITAIDADTGEATLSKPLPKALAAGEKIRLTTLKHPPLYPVGSDEFNETAKGWERYVKLVCDAVEAAGVDDFDIEVWNELTFGSRYLDVNNYYRPKVAKFDADVLHKGGQAWELGRRTVAVVDRLAPGTHVIWGFSNTTFFHTPIAELPPGIDGQSYHPYHTGTVSLPREEVRPEKPRENIDGFVPTMKVRLPEGIAATFIQTESVLRLLQPDARRRHPPGVAPGEFLHYMTEHGVRPPEVGIDAPAAAWAYKAKADLRLYTFWLGKGVDVLHLFNDHDREATGFGILPVDLTKLDKDIAWEEAATPPMRAIRRLTEAFADSQPVERVTQVTVEAVALGPERHVFEGDASRGVRPLMEREVLFVQPFQTAEDRFIIAAYLMTRDATVEIEPRMFELTLGNLPGPVATLQATDPLTGEPVTVERITSPEAPAGTLTLRLPLTDSPRLVTLQIGKPSAGR